jgi:hypothetical protein
MKIKHAKNKFSLESLTLDDMIGIRRSMDFFLSNFDGCDDGFTKKQVNTVRNLDNKLDLYLATECHQLLENF